MTETTDSSPSYDGLAKEPNEKDACLENGNRGKPTNTGTGTKKQNKFLEAIQSLALTRRGKITLGVSIALCVLFLIIIIILATQIGCNRKLSSDICGEPECLVSTARVMGAINESDSPCKNMWRYSCGTWIAKHEVLPKDLGSYSMSDYAENEFVEKIQKIVTTLPHVANLHSVEWKLKQFFQSCMNLDQIESTGLSQLTSVIHALWGWHVLGTWTQANWDWASVLLKLQTEHGVFPFFESRVHSDPASENHYIIQIVPSGLGLPDKDYYFLHPEHKVIRAYKQYVKDVATNLGATGVAATALAEEIFYFEKRIAAVYPVEGNKLQERITIADLQYSSQRIQWLEHLNFQFEGVGLTEATPVLVQSKQYLIDISTILSTTDVRSLNSYLIWTLVHKYCPYLSTHCRLPYEELQRTLTGATRSRERWRVCTEYSLDVFTSFLFSLFIEKEVPEEAFESASTVFEAVKRTFLSKLNDVDWLDHIRKSDASDKVRKLTGTFTREQFIMSSYEANAFYSKLLVYRASFFANTANSFLFKNLLMKQLLQRHTLPSWEFADIGHSKVSLQISRNRMVVSPQLLTEPYFAAHYPVPMKFGGLGIMLTRALLRGFEFLENFYEEQGQLVYVRQGPPPSIFRKQEECVYNLLHGMEFNGTRVDGNKTYHETMIEISAVNLAFKSLKDWQSDHGMGQRFPIIDITEDEHFFLTYSQSLCKVTNRESLETESSLSRYAPNYVRVNDIMVRSPAFLDAYDCRSYGSSPWEDCLIL